MRSCDKNKRRVCAEKEEGISVIKEKRGEVQEFIKEQLRKRYIRLAKSS